jgi:hypothetical protein
MKPSTIAVTAAALLVALVLVAVPAFATPICGRSWDGDPPGNLVDLTGIPEYQWSFGTGLFLAGDYTITLEGSYTSWKGFDYIDVLGDLLIPTNPVIGMARNFTVNQPFALTATSLSVFDAPSTGEQWAFKELTNNVWRWQLEDIKVGLGDQDYQDLYGYLVYHPPVTREIERVDPVPEPTTISLLILGTAGLVRSSRSGYRRLNTTT